MGAYGALYKYRKLYSLPPVSKEEIAALAESFDHVCDDDELKDPYYEVMGPTYWGRYG